MRTPSDILPLYDKQVYVVIRVMQKVGFTAPSISLATNNRVLVLNCGIFYISPGLSAGTTKLETRLHKPKLTPEK